MTQCYSRTLEDCMRVASAVDEHVESLTTLLDHYKINTHYQIARLDERFTQISSALEASRDLLECICEGREVLPESIKAARMLCVKALGTIHMPNPGGAQE
jgi:hypothetical protein